MPLDGWLEESIDVSSALVRARRFQAAAVMACRAIAVEPNNEALWINLGGAMYGLRRYEQAHDALLTALQVAPGHPFALGNLSLVLDGMDERAAADAAIAEAISHGAEEPSLRWNRAIMRLRRGDLGGFVDYDARIENDPKNYPTLHAPMWSGEPLNGKTIYVDTEQGCGDVILFSRYLPWLAETADRVLFRAPDPARPLLGAMPVELVGKPTQADYAVYLGSVPSRYDHSCGPPRDWSIRAAVLDSPSVDLPAPRGPGLKVGICWAGSANGESNFERSVPLEKLLTLAVDPRVWLYSLQVNERSADVEALGAGNFVADPSRQLLEGGFLATGRAILECDLVVTCCTSVAHLAGALGHPCWVLLSREPYWPWRREGAHCEWYPSVRLFRQERMGEWDPVIARVQGEIAKL